MKPRISIVTLEVRDLERARAFYQDGLGWPAPWNYDPDKGITDDHLAFKMEGGLTFVLIEKKSKGRKTIAKSRASSSGTVLTYEAGDSNEVKTIVKRAQLAGGTVLEKPAKTDWGGFGGTFADPDGHRWEIVKM